MTGSVIIDVCIGLIFVFLLYSLLASILQEWIATLLAFRAKVLEKAIIRMLEDDSHINWFIVLFRKHGKLGTRPAALAFYSHPLIKYLGSGKKYSKPAYISRENFSKVMLDLLTRIDIDMERNGAYVDRLKQGLKEGKVYYQVVRRDKTPAHPVEVAVKKIEDAYDKKVNRIKDGLTEDVQKMMNRYVSVEFNHIAGRSASEVVTAGEKTENEQGPKITSASGELGFETQMFLQSLWADAYGDAERFKIKLEEWYDDTMQRAIGWYKICTQYILFALGLILAISFNIDAIDIAKKLSHDPDLREQMVQNAATFAENNKDLAQRLSLADSAQRNILKPQYDSSIAHAARLLDSAQKLVNTDIKKVNELLALGWACPHDTIAGHKHSEGKYDGIAALQCTISNTYKNTSIPGWILTAFAISLGAPFWFDMLNKIMKLRSAGTRERVITEASQIPPANSAKGRVG